MKKLLLIVLVLIAGQAHAQKLSYLLITQDVVAQSEGSWSLDSNLLVYNTDTKKAFLNKSTVAQIKFYENDKEKFVSIELIVKDEEGNIVSMSSYLGKVIDKETPNHFRGKFVQIAGGQNQKQGQFLLKPKP